MNNQRPRVLLFLLLWMLVGLSAPLFIVGKSDELDKAARSIVDAARYCTLITLDEEGHPQARAMDPFPPEKNWTIWLATKNTTRKVKQIQNDSRVTLFYLHPQAAGYVTIIGDAQLVDRPEQKAKYWKESWSEFYEEGSSGQDYVLIRVHPIRIEVVSIPDGIPETSETWLPAMLHVRE